MTGPKKGGFCVVVNWRGLYELYLMCWRINFRQAERDGKQSKEGGTTGHLGVASSLFTVHGGNVGQEYWLNSLLPPISVYMHAHVDFVPAAW